MAEQAQFEFGGSDGENPGASQSLDEISVEELMAYPERPQRVDWAKTWYPVEMDAFQELNQAATQPDAETAPEEARVDESADADLDIERESDTREDDIGEDELDPEFAAMSPETLAPALRTSFEGIPATGWQPPDNTIAVGNSDVLVAVNTDLAGYRKSGQLRFRWNNMTTLFRRVLPQGAGLFDPRVYFDHYARRWIVIVDARRNNPVGSWIMLAVSRTTDPRGSYWVWALDARLDGSTTTNNWADYTTVGFDTQGLYLSNNMFAFNGGFQYSKLRILNKSELYAGGNGPNHTVKWFDFWNIRNPDGSLAFTIQPCVHYRGRGANSPAYLVNALWPKGTTLTLWTLQNPLAHWSGGRPSLGNSSVACRYYDLPPDAEQKGTAAPIETNDTRLLNAIYQHVRGVRRIWTAHTTKISWRGDNAARSALQWYEIDVPSGRVEQQNAYGAKGKYYYFPAIQTDIRRNTYLVFGRSSATEYASLRETGRRQNATPNDLENSRLVKSGESAYSGNRWGDYFGICRDGDDPRQVWCYGEFADARGRWGTWVGEIGY